MKEIKPEVKPMAASFIESLDDLTGGSWSKRFTAPEGVLLDTEGGVSDVTLAKVRELSSKHLLTVLAPVQVSVLSSKHLGAEEESGVVVFKTPEQIREDLLKWGLGITQEERHIPRLVIGEPVLNSAVPMPQVAHRLQPIRVVGEAEGGGMEGRKLAQLRTFESILNCLETLPQSNPTGRARLTPINGNFDSDALDSWAFENIKAKQTPRIRGLLRSKTKKGPKRKFNGR